MSSQKQEVFIGKFLTGIPEVDQNILLDLDYKSLKEVCMVNVYAKNLCEDDCFWNQKLMKL